MVLEMVLPKQGKMVEEVLAGVGALNWGIVALGQPDLVELLATTVNLPVLDVVIKVIVGVAGIGVLLRALKLTK